jgi:hypothetical protein
MLLEHPARGLENFSHLRERDTSCFGKAPHLVGFRRDSDSVLVLLGIRGCFVCGACVVALYAIFVKELVSKQAQLGGPPRDCYNCSVWFRFGGYDAECGY